MAASVAKLTFLISLLHSSMAIRCFICQSQSNPACQDPMKSYQLQLTECTPDVMRASSRELWKALRNLGGVGAHLGEDMLDPPHGHGHGYSPISCQKIAFYVGSERVVVRGCQSTASWNGDSHAMCRKLQEQANNLPGSYVEHCDTCDRDACNTVAPLAAPLAAPLLAAALLLANTLAR